MKRQMIYVLSAICLMMTACSGQDNEGSLPEMPRNTAGMTETTVQTTTAPVTTNSSVLTLTTLSSQQTSRLNAGSGLYTSLTVSSAATMLTLSTSSSPVTTTTVYIPPVTLPTVTSSHSTTLAATSSKQDLIAEAELLARQLQDNMFLAENTVQAAKTALADANASLEQAQSAMESYQAEHEEDLQRYAAGSKGFFQHCGAQDAVDVLENAVYAFFTEIGNENDATSLKNMHAALELLKKCNELRVAEGMHPLKVTDRMMAIAQSNLNYSDEKVQHSQQFDEQENLAWGFSDPFEGWYYGEKELKGEHYMKIVSPDFTVTGFAVCNANRSGRYTESHGQVFSSADTESAYTVAEYEQRFNEYYDSVQRVQTELSVLQKTVSDAQASAAAQVLAVSQAEQVLKEAEEAYTKAEEQLNQLRNE